MILKTAGIVIRRQNFSEADRILTIFTERFGKVKAIAKGVRKIKSHLAGSLEPFVLSDLQLHEGKTFYTVTGAAVKNGFPVLHEDLRKMAGAFYVGELVDKFEKEGQKSERVFELLARMLEVVDRDDYRQDQGTVPSGGQSPLSSSLILRIFEVQLLKESGFWGDLSICLHCKKKLQPAENYWDGEEGGIICGRCQGQFHHGRLVSNNLIKFFRLVEKEGFDLTGRFNFKRELAAEAESVLSGYIKGVLESDLKSRHFLHHLS